mmetsp:Transcript_26098/g.69456  ORF Transcript_26098/g.69456 Transcript_26098/m.69456 type:complete len:155 (+) Transcript_26098:163-627(+)
MATNFPGSFSGYELKITESHQSTKADTSGTAKAVADTLATLISDEAVAKVQANDYEEIVRVRDTDAQLAGAPEETPQLNCVPEDALNGHAFHTYSLVSGDGSVEFQFRHNVAGRRMYAEGTTDAVGYLAKQIQAKGGATQRIYSMVDVLNAGAL